MDNVVEDIVQGKYRFVWDMDTENPLPNGWIMLGPRAVQRVTWCAKTEHVRAHDNGCIDDVLRGVAKDGITDFRLALDFWTLVERACTAVYNKATGKPTDSTERRSKSSSSKRDIAPSAQTGTLWQVSITGNPA